MTAVQLNAISKQILQETYRGIADPLDSLGIGYSLVVTANMGVSEVPENNSKLVAVVVNLDISDLRVLAGKYNNALLVLN